MISSFDWLLNEVFISVVTQSFLLLIGGIIGGISSVAISEYIRRPKLEFDWNENNSGEEDISVEIRNRHFYLPLVTKINRRPAVNCHASLFISNPSQELINTTLYQLKWKSTLGSSKTSLNIHSGYSRKLQILRWDSDKEEYHGFNYDPAPASSNSVEPFIFKQGKEYNVKLTVWDERGNKQTQDLKLTILSNNVRIEEGKTIDFDPGIPGKEEF